MRDRLRNLFERLIGNAALSKVIGNASWLFGAEAIATVSSFVRFPITTRLLGAAGYGVLQGVINWAGLVTALFTIRVRETIIKYLTRFMAADDESGALAMVKLAFIIDIGLSIFAAGLVYLSADIAGPLFIKVPDAPLLIRLAALHLLCMTTQGATWAIIMVFDRVRWLSLYNAGSTLLHFGLVVAALLAGYEVAGVLVALALVAFTQSTVMLVKANRLLHGHFSVGWTAATVSVLRPMQRDIAVMLFSINVDALRKVATGNADVVILGYFSNPAVVGVYAAAKKLATYANRISDPIYNLVYPELARLYGAGDMRQVWPFVRRLTLLFAAGLVLMVVVVALFAAPLILALFGPEYEPSIPLFYLALGYNVWVLMIWAPGFLLTLGKARDLTIINTISASIMVVAALVLAPVYQATGVIAAFVLHYVVWTVMVALYIWRLNRVELRPALEATGETVAK